MTVVRYLPSLCSLLACALVSGCASTEAFIESRALQHKSGTVTVCRTSDAEAAGKSLAEQVCRDNWLPAPALVRSTLYSCAISAPVRDVYQCGGSPSSVVRGNLETSVVTGAVSSSSVTDKVLSINVDTGNDRPMLFSQGDQGR